MDICRKIYVSASKKLLHSWYTTNVIFYLQKHISETFFTYRRIHRETALQKYKIAIVPEETLYTFISVLICQLMKISRQILEHILLSLQWKHKIIEKAARSFMLWTKNDVRKQLS